MATNDPEYMRAWREKNKTRLQEYERNRYVGERREKMLNRSKLQRENNPEETRQYNKLYYQNNKENMNNQAKLWRADPKNLERRRELGREKEARRRARKNEVNIEDCKSYSKILYCDPCVYCGAKMNHLDHIVPISKNGDHVWDNLTSACSFCNLSKGNKSLLEFLL